MIIKFSLSEYYQIVLWSSNQCDNSLLTVSLQVLYVSKEDDRDESKIPSSIVIIHVAILLIGFLFWPLLLLVNFLKH